MVDLDTEASRRQSRKAAQPKIYAQKNVSPEARRRQQAAAARASVDRARMLGLQALQEAEDAAAAEEAEAAAAEAIERERERKRREVVAHRAGLRGHPGRSPQKAARGSPQRQSPAKAKR